MKKIILFLFIGFISITLRLYSQAPCSGVDCLEQVPWSDEITCTRDLNPNDPGKCILEFRFRVRDGVCQPSGQVILEVQITDILVRSLTCEPVCGSDEELFQKAISLLIFDNTQCYSWNNYYYNYPDPITMKVVLPQCWKDVSQKKVHRLRPCANAPVYCCTQTYTILYLGGGLQQISNSSINPNPQPFCNNEGQYVCNNVCNYYLPDATQGIINPLMGIDKKLFSEAGFYLEKTLDVVSLIFNSDYSLYSSVEVFDILGNRIFYESISLNRVYFPTQSLSSGIYFYRIKGMKNNYTGNFSVIN